MTELLGTSRYERTDERRGYRNGRTTRTVTTESGPTEFSVPRARIADESGATTEFHSEVLPRYARRTRKVDEAIIGVYLAGANSRRIRKALAPMLGEANLSKSAIFGDPDFDILAVRAGRNFGLPSPGHTTLTRQGPPRSDFLVDSFFDVFYEIDFQGAPGSILEGFAGTTQGIVRMQAVGLEPTPVLPSTWGQIKNKHRD